MKALPLILEAEQLQPQLNSTCKNLLIVDLSSESSYLQGHIPGAIHLPFQTLMSGQAPAPGRLPEEARLQQLGAFLGLHDDLHIVAYDDEGGGWAGRFIWTLDVLGHNKASYLNGGIHAWRGLGYEQQTDASTPSSNSYLLPALNHNVIANIDDILPQLGTNNVVVWDARSSAEYRGEKVFSAHGGHIPGAINCDWANLMDRNRDLRIRTDAEEFLAKLGLDKTQDIITHCQSHHRSGLTYLVGKNLGFKIRAYHGSWGEWGNTPGLPIEK